MKQFLAGATITGVICFFIGYTTGFKAAMENMFLRKVATAADSVREGVAAVKDFPRKFGEKVDGIVEEVKSWFRFRRGKNGEIILDESSPIWRDVDDNLRSGENPATPIRRNDVPTGGT
jgi:hypothetical protein